MPESGDAENSKFSKIISDCGITDQIASISEEFEVTERSESFSGLSYTHLIITFVKDDVPPLHLLIKRIPKNHAGENAALSLHEIFANEISFYNTFVQDAQKFISENVNQLV